MILEVSCMNVLISSSSKTIADNLTRHKKATVRELSLKVRKGQLEKLYLISFLDVASFEL